jgi:hypothetical protein
VRRYGTARPVAASRPPAHDQVDTSPYPAATWPRKTRKLRSVIPIRNDHPCHVFPTAVLLGTGMRSAAPLGPARRSASQRLKQIYTGRRWCGLNRAVNCFDPSMLLDRPWLFSLCRDQDSSRCCSLAPDGTQEPRPQFDDPVPEVSPHRSERRAFESEVRRQSLEAAQRARDPASDECHSGDRDLARPLPRARSAFGQRTAFDSSRNS